MIRKEVEKLRGMVLTPEELEEVILPLVAATKEEKKHWKLTYWNKKKNYLSGSKSLEVDTKKER